MRGGYYNYITNSNPRAAHEGESTKHKPKKPPHAKCGGGKKKENPTQNVGGRLLVGALARGIAPDPQKKNGPPSHKMRGGPRNIYI